LYSVACKAFAAYYKMGSREPELQGETEGEQKQKQHTPTHKERER
jgi:hypothetical protein